MTTEEIVFYSKVLSLITLSMLVVVIDWSYAKSVDFEKAAYGMGDLALAQNLTSNNKASVQMFSLTPLVGVGALIVIIFQMILFR